MSAITNPGRPDELRDATVENLAPPKDNGLHYLVNEQAAKDAWMLLLVIRCANALAVRTFFQPDEYFQSLEPAWQMAFGPQSGAWITWEWHHQLRSSLHPTMFAIVYFVADKAMSFISFFPQFRAMILAVLPNLVQAYFAAVGDYYTWQMAERIYGTGTEVSSAVFWMTVFSPWQWFCSTRTFSNCLETAMTITALYFWPWALSTDTILGKGSDASHQVERDELQPTSAKNNGVFETAKSIKHLRISLVLAGIACIFRPTNGLIWFSILMPTLNGLFKSTKQVLASDYAILVREAVFCGAAVILLSVTSDRIYFGEWTFPPYQWLHFNISQDLAVFYGRNDWHYYLSQGLPLLLTTYMPFTLVALYQTSLLPSSNIRYLFTTTILLTLGSLSLISHKEVRFIYPLLPLLHILTAPTISAFFQPEASDTTSRPKSGTQSATDASSPPTHQKALFTILILNILVAGYTTLSHQSGVLSVTTFLRQEYEALALDGRGRLLSHPDAGIHDPIPKTTTYTDDETFVGFLMPCHSTPWRSSLIHPGLKAWALGCEPPIHLSPHTPERAKYRDEADRFYDNPLRFLGEEVNTKERPWPRYIVGFEGIEKDLKTFFEGKMKGFRVQERWRTRNSHWHDDWRRTGDVVVWEFVDGSLVQEN